MSHQALSPQQFHEQRLFDPEYPPISPGEHASRLESIRAEMRRRQLERVQRHNVERP